MNPLRSCVLPCLLAAGLAGQTTGVPGINDLTVSGGGPLLGSGTTSCFNACFPNGNVNLNYQVSAPAGALVFLAFSFCPCVPCSVTAPANACVPVIPNTACLGSNQSFDLDINAACGLILLAASVSSAGTLGAQIPVPPIPGPPCSSLTLSCQAVIFDPCGLGITGFGGPFLLSQAITASF